MLHDPDFLVSIASAASSIRACERCSVHNRALLCLCALSCTDLRWGIPDL
jgi:hypothetical protein